MFLALLIKQIKIILRSPQELLMLLLMPIILIFILSFALGSIMNGEVEKTKVELAVVQHDNEEEQLQAFIEKVSNTNTIPMNDEFINNLHQMLPVSMLLDQTLNTKELKQIIRVTQLDKDELKQARKDDKYDAIIEVPKDFTVNYLSSLFLNEEKPSFNVYLNENEQIASTVVQSVLDYYQNQYSLFTQLSKNNLLSENLTIPKAKITSDIKTVESQKQISSSVYYTFSMSVMFILYMASTMASQAFLEKNMHIFDRILLARISTMTYLASIIVATIILAFAQVIILFTVSHFAFHISYTHWELYFLLTLMLSLVVGGIAAILSSLNYRKNSADASNIFSSAFVAILALLGGSYFNISSMSPVLSKIGQWTPNGAALNGYLSIIQNGSFSDIQVEVIILAILAFTFTTIAFLLFPKRGGIA